MIFSIALTAVLGLSLALAGFVDVKSRRIPDVLTAFLISLGLVLATSYTMPNLLAAALGFLSFYLIARVYRSVRGYDGLGLGDAKLLAAAGAWLGPLYLAPVVFVSAILAIGVALILRLLGREVSLQTTLPFGPFLSVSFFGFWCLKISGWSLFS